MWFRTWLRLLISKSLKLITSLGQEIILPESILFDALVILILKLEWG